jgi:hypothetical protein
MVLWERGVMANHGISKLSLISISNPCHPPLGGPVAR